MKKLSLIIVIVSVLGLTKVLGQDNVGIGTTTPHSSAILELDAADKGLLVTRVTLQSATNGTSPVNSPATGLLVYNTGGSMAAGYYYWDGSQWTMIGSGGGASCYTLDEAYDCGGAGVGNAITADNNQVEITLPSGGTSTSALDVYSDKASSWAIGAENTNTGVAVIASITSTTNQNNAIQGSSFSNYNTGSIGSGGVAGYYEGTGNGIGVYGSVTDATSDGVAGVFGYNQRTDGGFGIQGQGYAGVVGEGVVTSINGFGVYGTTQIGNGVQGETNDMAFYGVSGVNYATTNTGDGIGVMGDGNTGVWGQTVDGAGYGVYGMNQSTGTSNNNIGVGGDGWVGVFGVTNDPASGFGVYSDGNLGSSGTKSFVIDHPLDPENKTLKHYCMESPEVLNIYRGNVELDQNGEAVVDLPDYFESINKNFSYNLTPIGAPVNLYIKEKIENGQFIIAGGEANMEVSWTVYAERNDKYVQEYPESTKVEVEKRQNGKYIRPELYGQPDEKSLFGSEKKNQEILKIENENSGKPGKKEPFKSR